MDSFLTFLQDNPLYIAGLLFLIIFIVISLIKKAVKLIAIAIILFVAYGYYLNNDFQSSKSAFNLIESKTQELID